mmetsp:Transcript_41136/g.129207  ORF Transcript_41136/g.129207 Transcript_41136/m.129207 type:complete len:86 (-) Transcript_41136:188-445(-)
MARNCRFMYLSFSYLMCEWEYLCPVAARIKVMIFRIGISFWFMAHEICLQETTMLWGHKKKAAPANAWGKRFAWLSCKKTNTCHK